MLIGFTNFHDVLVSEVNAEESKDHNTQSHASRASRSSANIADSSASSHKTSQTTKIMHPSENAKEVQTPDVYSTSSPLSHKVGVSHDGVRTAFDATHQVVALVSYPSGFSSSKADLESQYVDDTIYRPPPGSNE